MRKSGHLENLADYLKHHPMKPGQSIEERALEVYQQGIQQYDALDAQERALREEEARIAYEARFYSLLHLDTREHFIVKVMHIDDFCRRYKLDKEKLLRVAEGEEREYKRFVQLPHLHMAGKPYKPPRPKHADDELVRLNREAEAERKRIDKLNQELYVVPPVVRTVHYTPNS